MSLRRRRFDRLTGAANPAPCALPIVPLCASLSALSPAAAPPALPLPRPQPQLTPSTIHTPVPRNPPALPPPPCPRPQLTNAFDHSHLPTPTDGAGLLGQAPERQGDPQEAARRQERREGGGQDRGRQVRQDKTSVGATPHTPAVAV